MKSKAIAHVRASDGEEQSLQQHLSSVSKLAAEFSLKLNAEKAGAAIGFLHDVGKLSSSFQAYIRSATGLTNPDADDYVDASGLKGKIDHSTTGAQLIWDECRKWGPQGMLVGQILALCVASHHSGLIDCISPDGRRRFRERMSKESALTHRGECERLLSDTERDTIRRMLGKELVRETAKTLAAIVRPVEKEKSNPLIQAFRLGFFTRILFSCLIDADRIDSADFEFPANRLDRAGRFSSWDTLVSRAEEFFSSLLVRSPIDTIRSRISNECKARALDPLGQFTLTVPTGGGKTFSSLRFALHHARYHRLKRIIYIIPYTSIIEQNADAIRQVLERDTDRQSLVLEHHSNLEPQQVSWRDKLVAQNWDAPVVLTTMVQFLEALFSGGTRGARRVHQLAESVIIFDEIQTLPVRCVHLFCNALNFLTEHCRTSAVFCTATQPLLHELKFPEKGQLVVGPANEIMPDVTELFDELKRVRVINRMKPGGWREDEIVLLAIEQFETHGSCLVIVNTKDWARRLYDLLHEQVASDALFYLSTNLCPMHRRDSFNRLRARLDGGERTLCVSTQLIEAGVDIDFSSVVRFAAGLDSIAQAAGRCNRSGNRQSAPVYVINPENEPLNQLRDIKEGRDVAVRVLTEGRPDPLCPEIMKRYFRYYFYNRADEMDYPISKNELGRDDTLLNLLSENSKVTAGEQPLLSQSFQTAGDLFQAIDSPTQGVIVPYGKRGREILADLAATSEAHELQLFSKLLREAQQYSVNVFPHTLLRLERNKALHMIQSKLYGVDEAYYSDEYGLCDEPTREREPLIL